MTSFLVIISYFSRNNHKLPRINISGYSISSRSHGFICLGHRGWPLPGTVCLCVDSPKKNQCFNSACLLSIPSRRIRVLCTALQISHNNVSYSLDVALAYISYKAHHCSSHFGDTDTIPYIVITEESNINVPFILYTSTIRTKCYELLL